MKFAMAANILFEAENLDGAFKLLEKHFGNLQQDEPEDKGWFEGTMAITKVEE